jgi:hypothetical protein
MTNSSTEMTKSGTTLRFRNQPGYRFTAEVVLKAPWVGVWELSGAT